MGYRMMSNTQHTATRHTTAIGHTATAARHGHGGTACTAYGATWTHATRRTAATPDTGGKAAARSGTVPRSASSSQRNRQNRKPVAAPRPDIGSWIFYIYTLHTHPEAVAGAAHRPFRGKQPRSQGCVVAVSCKPREGVRSAKGAAAACRACVSGEKGVRW
jgi:hypothetical protein